MQMWISLLLKNLHSLRIGYFNICE
jgi:hypothetical protein